MVFRVRTNKRILAVCLVVLIVGVFFAGYQLGLMQTQNSTIIIEPGSFTETATYVIYGKDTNNDGILDIVYAKNGVTGVVEFSGTDVANVIQSVINYVSNKGGGIVFIKQGTYELVPKGTDASGNAYCLMLKSNVRLIGEGWNTVLRLKSGYRATLIYIENAENIAVEKMYLDGNRPETAEDFSSYYNCIIRAGTHSTGAQKREGAKNAIFRDLFLTRAERFAIDIAFSNNVTIENIWTREGSGDDDISISMFSKNIVVRNVYVINKTNPYNFGVSAGIEVEDGASKVLIDGAFIEASHNVTTGMCLMKVHDYVADEVAAQGMTDIVIKNTIIVGAKYGIYYKPINGCRRLTISDVTIINPAEYGIVRYGLGSFESLVINNVKVINAGKLAAEAVPAMYIALDKHVTIQSCEIINSTLGIKIYNCSYVQISGCRIYNNSYDGITVYQSSFVSIVDNSIYNNGQEGWGIGIVVNTISDVIIRGNNIFDDQNTPTQNRAIKIGSAVTNAVVTWNYIGQHTSTPYIKDDSGAAIIKHNNGFTTENSGIATGLSNGATIAHGLADIPSIVVLTCLNATYDGVPVIVSWNKELTDATNIVVNIYWANGTAITDPVIAVSWYAEV